MQDLYRVRLYNYPGSSNCEDFDVRVVSGLGGSQDPTVLFSQAGATAPAAAFRVSHLGEADANGRTLVVQTDRMPYELGGGVLGEVGAWVTGQLKRSKAASRRRRAPERAREEPLPAAAESVADRRERLREFHALFEEEREQILAKITDEETRQDLLDTLTEAYRRLLGEVFAP